MAITDEEIEAVALKHEAFGFGAIGPKGLSAHAFDPGGLLALARAIEARVRQEAVPVGWQLVPMEPTPEMLHAAARRKYAWENGNSAGTGDAYQHFDKAIQRDKSGEHCADGMYRAMLAASPSLPQKGGDK